MATASGKNRKVAIIGLEAVTATEIYSLLVSGRIQNVVLVGTGARKLLQELNGLRAMVPLSTPAVVEKGSIRECLTAEIAVVSSPANIADATIAEIRRAVAQLRTSIDELREIGFSGVILVTGSPIEILVRAAVEGSGFPAERVFGIGNRSDFSAVISGLSDTGSLPLTPVIDHTSTAIPKGWCTAAGANVSYIDSCRSDCPFFETVAAAPKVAAPYHDCGQFNSPQRLAACVTQVCESVIDDLFTIAPVFVFRSGAVIRCACTIDHSGIGKGPASGEETIAPNDRAAAEKIWSMVNADPRPTAAAI